MVKVAADGPDAGDPPVATDEERTVAVIAAALTITEKKVASIKDGGLTATPASIREEVGTTEITLKVVLDAKLDDPAPVAFSISSEDNAERDINYTIDFGDLTIPAGDTEGTTTATLTPVNDTAGRGNRVITVMASVANSDRTATITITDDDVLTEHIKLSAAPAELKEDAEGNEEGYVDVTITATLDGAVFDDKVTLKLVLDGGSATRDQDYTAIIRSLEIEAERGKWLDDDLHHPSGRWGGGRGRNDLREVHNHAQKR